MKKILKGIYCFMMALLIAVLTICVNREWLHTHDIYLALLSLMLTVVCVILFRKGFDFFNSAKW